MRRLHPLAMALGFLVGSGAGNVATALELPPPQLVPLLRLAAPALDKPPVTIPALGLPGPPRALPGLPLPPLETGERPTAPLPPPRVLACNPLGSVFGVGSELVECGRARFQRGELAEALSAFQGAVQRSTDRVTLREGRYWLAETLLRLDRRETAEHHLRLVAQEDPHGELGMYATHALGWIELRHKGYARALASFEQLLRGSVLPELVPHARHGRALSLYALGRHAEAREAWSALLTQSIPRALATEATFWVGDTLGRLGDHSGAVARLQVFAAAGPGPLTEAGLLRLGWWSRAAGQPLEAVKAYRGLLSAYPQTPEGLWARVGLVQALLDLDDLPAARDEALRLENLDQTGSLALPTLLLLARFTVEKSRADEARMVYEELLGRSLEAPARAYVLLLSGEMERQAGRPEEARNQFGLVRTIAPGTPYAWQATLRLAEMDLAAREFAQARTAAEGLLHELLTPELRAAALVVAAESAYWARGYERAAVLYRRLLSETAPRGALAEQASFALGWAELRRGRVDLARQIWTRFGEDFPAEARAPAALLLAAELAAQSGDEAGAQALLDQLVGRFPDGEHVEVAILNRAILALRAGRASAALLDLGELVRRARLSPFVGRIRVARGVALLAVGRTEEARSDFGAALGQGDDALTRLGLASVALDHRRWDEAARDFTEARQTGTAPVVAAAEYGLAATAFNEGRREEFTRLAGALLSRAPDPATTPHLLEAMGALAAADQKWPEARMLVLRILTEFPEHPGTPAALGRLAAAASAEAQWPLVREAYQLLEDRFPRSAENRVGRVDFAQSFLRTGAAPEARRRLQAFVDATPGDPEMPRALLLLAQAMEAAGDRAAAVEVYARLGREHPKAPGAPSALLGQARLLQGQGKWEEARPALDEALANPDPVVASEAAYRMGEGLRAEGLHEDAVELYMTAAYMAPDSPWARRALLGAGESFTLLKEPAAAAIVYRKLLATRGVEAPLAETARRKLRALNVD